MIVKQLQILAYRKCHCTGQSCLQSPIQSVSGTKIADGYSVSSYHSGNKVQNDQPRDQQSSLTCFFIRKVKLS